MSRLRRKKSDTASKSNNSYTSLSKKQKTIDFGRKGDDDDDQIIDSDQEEDAFEDDRRLQQQQGDSEDDIEEEETLDAKKIRLAREYLRKLEADDDDDDEDSDGSSSSDEDDDDDHSETEHDRIGLKLQRERLKREGTYERMVADKVQVNLERIHQSLSRQKAAATTSPSQQAKQWIDNGHIRLFRGHDLTPTCVGLQSNGERAISGSKDHSVIVWDVQKERRAFTLCPEWKKESDEEHEATSRTMGEVLSVACSDDGRYAAVGRRDATVCIYDVRVNNQHKSSSSESLVKTFSGHKGPVTSLCFRTQSLQLFSGSSDRCIRHYNLNEMMYLETLYGHQFGVTDVDCHKKERPVSVGRDRTARAWKIAEDTHLIFRGGAKLASADCVRVLKEDWFLTGHEDGHLGLWMTEKKRAVASIDVAHGAVGNVPRGITAIGSLRGSDLAVSGSSDGYLRLWKLMMGQTLDTRTMEPLGEIPLTGYVNGIAVGPKARFCVVAVGQEPKMGRWDRVAGAKNRFGIVRLRSEEDVNADEDDPVEIAAPTQDVGNDESSEDESGSSSNDA